MRDQEITGWWVVSGRGCSQEMNHSELLFSGDQNKGGFEDRKGRLEC